MSKCSPATRRESVCLYRQAEWFFECERVRWAKLRFLVINRKVCERHFKLIHVMVKFAIKLFSCILYVVLLYIQLSYVYLYFVDWSIEDLTNGFERPFENGIRRSLM